MTSGTTPAKRKRSSGFALDSDDEEPEYSDTEELGSPTQVTKRAKLVTPPEPPQPLDSTATGDHPTPHPVPSHPSPPPVATNHPVPSHPGTGVVSGGVPGDTTAAPPEPAADPTPVAPHLIPSTGKGPNAVSDDDFNSTHEINYAPLNEAADEVLLNPSDKTLSEALGEQGAVAYLQAHTGHFDVELHHATVKDPHTLAPTVGQRWSHAVGFNGAHVADVSYWDGAQFHVIEAKGGESQLGQRTQTKFHEATDGAAVMADAQGLNLGAGAINNLNAALFNSDDTPKTFKAGDNIPNAVKSYLPTTLNQGTMPYLTDIAHTMVKSKVGDGRNLVGQAILDNGDNVHYQPVSSQASKANGVDVHTMDIDS